MGHKKSRQTEMFVEPLRQQVEHWRRTRTKRSPMPEPLWQAAVGLAREHGVHAAAQALGLSYDSLRRRDEAVGSRGGYAETGARAASRRQRSWSCSKPLLDDLQERFATQIEERKIEPNSSIGDAIEYMTKHWDALTLFLRVPGAPLDNNVCERILKKAILHCKTALFYKTMSGARVGDLFMSIIHTAELAKIDVFATSLRSSAISTASPMTLRRGCPGTTVVR